MAEKKKDIKVEYDEDAAPHQRFENLLRQLVSVPAEKVKQIVEKEKRLRKKKRPK